MSNDIYKTKQLQIVSVKLPNECIVVRLMGVLDSSSVLELESAVKQWLDKGIVHFVFDLSGITQLTSSGAGFFINLHRILCDHRGVLLFTQPSEIVKEIFDLLGLTLCINIVPDLQTGRAIMNKITQGERIKDIKIGWSSAEKIVDKRVNE